MANQPISQTYINPEDREYKINLPGNLKSVPVYE